jgi:hypothetical protein
MLAWYIFWLILVPIYLFGYQASKEARKAHWIWKNKGNSNGSAESERKDMIKKKRTLRDSIFLYLQI